MADNDEYIPVELVASRLKLSVRQATRYADRVRTIRSGRRILFHRDDVEALADELGVEYRPPPLPRADLVPAGEMLQTFERQQAQIAALSMEVGRLQGLLEGQKQLTADTEDVRRQLADVEAERDRLRAELEQLHRRPWWHRLFGN